MMNFNEYFKSLRLSKKLSQRKLAVLSSISNTEVMRIEKGERPSLKTLMKVAPHLGVPAEHLFRTAGYLEKVIDHDNYSEHLFFFNGELIDILRKAQEVWKLDRRWSDTAFRIATELPEEDRQKVFDFAEALFQKVKENQKQKKG